MSKNGHSKYQNNSPRLNNEAKYQRNIKAHLATRESLADRLSDVTRQDDLPETETINIWGQGNTCVCMCVCMCECTEIPPTTKWFSELIFFLNELILVIPYSQSNWFRRHESSVNNKLHPLEQTEWRLDVYGVMQLGLFARSSSIFAVGTSNYISYFKKKKAYKSIDRVKFTLFNEMPCKAISHGFNCPIFISFNM